MLKDIPRRMDNQPVRIYASITDLITLVIDQNFVLSSMITTSLSALFAREVLEHYTRLNPKKKQPNHKPYKYSGVLADASI